MISAFRPKNKKMLDVTKIDSTLIWESDWMRKRRGKITASKFGCLISDKSHIGKFSKGGETYLSALAMERVKGMAVIAQFSSENTDYGNAYEPDAVRFFQKTTGRVVLENTGVQNNHKLIHLNDCCCVTPDGLVALTPTEDTLFDDSGQFMKVAPLEVKCPPKRFLEFYQCVTPSDLKKAEKTYYWQQILQIYVVNSLIGWWGAYQPYTPPDPDLGTNGTEEKMRIIEFKKIDLIEDFKKCSATLVHAEARLKELVRIYEN